MEKKYKLTKETKTINSVTLHRIEALRDFGNVKKGEKGGWIQSEDNLSHEDNCWIYNNACVYQNAKVYRTAWVYDNAWVFGSARVFGNAMVYGNAYVYGTACVYKNARISGDAWVYGDACVYDNAQVYGDAQVSGNARLQIGKYDEGKITETPMVIISSLFVVNKCGNGIFIGCKKLTAEEWLGDKGKELAIENDFTEKEINEYKKIIQFITKF